MRFSILTAVLAGVVLTGCGEAEDPAPAAPARTKLGLVRIYEMFGMNVNACFREGPITHQWCATSTVAGCAVSDCTFPSSGIANGPPIAKDSAGVITVVGVLADGGVGVASTAPEPVPQSEPTEPPPAGSLPGAGSTVGGNGSHSLDSHPMRHWAEGTPLTITASGGRAPAFSVGLTAPRPIQVTAPASTNPRNPFIPTPVRVAEPLPVVWTGDPQATVIARLYGSANRGGSNRHLSIECVLPRSPAAIPAEVLGRLAQVEAEGYGFQLSTVNQATLVAGEYDVIVEAAGNSGTFLSLSLVK